MIKRTIGYLPLILAMALLVVTVVYAHGGDTSLIHSCVDQNGKIRIVAATATCTKTESSLDWSIQGPPGPQGPPGSGAELVVIDSQNQEMGVLVGNYGNNFLWHANQYWITIQVNPARIPQVVGFYVSYETLDCSGIPYMTSSGMFRQGYVIGTKVYYDADPIQARYLHSYRLEAPPNILGNCVSDPGSPDAIEAGPLASYDLPEFTPPFTIRVGP